MGEVSRSAWRVHTVREGNYGIDRMKQMLKRTAYNSELKKVSQAAPRLD
jgi:hypothetical protein